MRWQSVIRLLGFLDTRAERHPRDPSYNTEPQLRIDSYSRLAHMDDHTHGGRAALSSTQPIHPGDAAALGRRLAGQEKWVRIDSEGKAQLVQVDKQELVQRLWIPVRDLLQLDPEVPIAYPSSIFIRERALVVNLESVRMIIAKDEVYVTSSPVPGSSELWQHPSPDGPFLKDLCHRLATDSPGLSSSSFNRKRAAWRERKMPYELKALEAGLAEAVTVLEIAVGNLERAAFPTLESLVHNVSRPELDKTRNVKSVTYNLLSRVGRIKKELEEILDDDQDMADMYLGRREELEVAEPRQRASLETQQSSGGVVGTPPRAGLAAAPLPATGSDDAEKDRSGRRGVSAAEDPRLETYDSAEDVVLEEFQPSKGPRELRTAHPHDIEDCENLLENFFMQVEFLHGRLTQLKERTDDTEDLINIELDQRRNELVSLDLILTALATAFGFVACVGGIFGMNLAPMPIEHTEVGFWVATFGAIAAGLLLLVGFLGYARWKKILLIPSN